LEQELLDTTSGREKFPMHQHRFLNVTFCLAAFAGVAAAQNWSKMAFNVGGGFTEPVVHTESRANTGFNITAGAGYKFVPQFGLSAEFGYNRLDLSDNVLTAAGVPGGNAHIYSATLQPTVHFNPQGRFGVYATGGGGFYRRTIDFTAPTLDTVTLFDPFYGVFFPAAVPATQILASFTQNKGGLNIGGGIEVRLKGDSNTKVYAEARYHYIYTTPIRTTILPVTFGFRW
jgi:opacity protein-like surface antigen